jgi:hypothetical protein
MNSNSVFRSLSLTLGVFLGATVFAFNANAQCGAADGHSTANNAAGLLSRSAPLLASAKPAAGQLASKRDDDDVSIVGFWHVKFVSDGSTGIPDGAVVDAGFSQWHADGTEILNSSRPPATSNFCLGVWERTGKSTYKLNHFALSSDLNGHMVGPAEIREDVTLSKDGSSYSGTFTIDQYDTAGNLLVHIQGNVSGTRITVDTKITDIL